MRVGAFDCGTNSIRLLIADIEGNNFREIYRGMEIVRLGEGVDKTGQFQPDAIERTLNAIDLFTVELRRRGVEKLRFVATSATRDATNRDLFLNGVHDRLGIYPEVITGDEEAALSFQGASRELPAAEGPFLVVDIGGGSTEFVFGRSDVEAAKSVNIGCVRMSERHFHTDPPAVDEIARATADINFAIEEAGRTVPIKEAKTLIAVAGTATTVAAAALELSEYDPIAIHLSRIPAAKVHEISKTFLKMKHAERAALPYMHEGRVDVITAGALVLSEILTATGAKEFVASESDILDGMAWSLAKS
ncbi:MAG: Ppx/GppA family phosphatase [Actinobacteria bacterium]|nr:Ppx/GppA family phosphatase [Actinomycetota bacterium]